MDYNRAKLRAELSRDEARKRRVYKDTYGHPTVGVGHNLDAGPLPGQRYPMSESEIDALLDRDIRSSEDKLDKYLPWWRGLDAVRQRVLLNMVFNLGIGRPGGDHGLLGFPNTLEMIKVGYYEAASNAMLKSLWSRQVGDRAKRLSAMMLTGDVPVIAQPAIPQAQAKGAPKKMLNISAWFSAEVIASVERKLLAIAGTALVSHGLATTDEANSLVGATIVIVSFITGLVQSHYAAMNKQTVASVGLQPNIPAAKQPSNSLTS